jgi:2-oxoglutarate ferredoxin oxidoreductase subunit gamma
MRIEIIVSGLGGQGVVFAGLVLGRAAAYSGWKVVQTQSYGAEARGSAARSEVIISDTEIGFPIVRRCGILVAMNQEAVDRNLKCLKEDGVLLVDSSIVKGEDMPQMTAKIVKIPATRIAEETLKDKLFANMIMLGALIKTLNIISEKAIENAINDSVSPEVAEVNFQAYRIGKDS